MLIQGLTPLGTPEILTRKQRVYGVAGGIILSFRMREPDDRGQMMSGTAHGATLMHEFLLMGEAQFIRTWRAAEAQYSIDNPDAPPSLNRGMSDAEYGECYACVVEYIHKVARKGMEWRRRKDSTI
jgi:hypothetical protein